MNNSRIIVAMDFSSIDEALSFADKIKPEFCKLKIGKQLFTESGPAGVEKLINKGFDVFLDLKFHDIPNTVHHACKAAAKLGVWMVNVHATGGRDMMCAAKEGIDSTDHHPLLIAVTVLTSIKDEDLKEFGVSLSTNQLVMNLAKLAAESGMDGVVCSADEVNALRNALGEKFCLVTPGIRPAGVKADDQKRIQTPYAAIKSGSDYIVIGRPVTQSPDPIAALLSIRDEVQQAENN